MDPRRARLWRSPCWLPRTRGDGPLTSWGSGIEELASPHTRGWTRPRGLRRDDGPGFPAHAGMDREDLVKLAGMEGLPRTRGDGPDLGLGGRRRVAASPHTRGWTQARQGARRQERGFPAHAGMDPTPARTDRPASRLPRTRGDGPVFVLPSPLNRSASPHTRGWTLDALAKVDLEPGFPAHAGMDPSSCADRPSPSGLPRTRGDGPLTSAVTKGYGEASPHTRGWTRRGRAAAAPGRGFPAHAGMDPPRSSFGAAP